MFTLRRSLLRELLHSKLKGYSGFVERWPLPEAPDRTTVWRWLKPETQVPLGSVLPLAGTFDLDPFALFEIRRDAYAALCRALVRTLGGVRRNPLKRDLQWAAPLVTPNKDWPPKEISRQYFSRSWFVREFFHSAADAQNFFQKVLLTAQPRKFGEPQVWHFAFRQRTSGTETWIPYGFVERQLEAISLYHYHVGGHSAKAQIASGAANFAIETWFGASAAEFRVARLHEFKIDLRQSLNPAFPSVRFP